MNKNILEIVEKANSAKVALLNIESNLKDEALVRVSQGIEKYSNAIFEANKKDLENASRLLENGEITQAVYDRLKLDEYKIKVMIKELYDVIRLKDPVNNVLLARELDDGLILNKVSCPIGLIGIIFEARPDVIIQVSALTIKSGNAVILKGGKEADNTNKILFEIVRNALIETKGFPVEAVNLVLSHDDIKSMLELDNYIDLIIPRGSNKLVAYIQENTKIPVLGHASGICHTFIDESAKKEMAEKIIIDAKTQYPSACNSTETLLVHKNYPYLEDLKNVLINNGVKIIENPEKYDFEYLDKTISFKIVESLDEAINHVNKYGSGHTDSIITENSDNVQKFMTLVDSANVFHNASTRFSDGYRYGFGAEVGISTNKAFARGPVGIEGLCTYKYKLYGSGQTVGEYSKGGSKRFHRKNL